ncbi:tetratricopeptide repeat protein [Porphyromonas macacae]|uniref:tetratricopeptide repeat protein n=1 Tax=Porphyromonas macacae TaxID=28115 RepID=UPI0024ACBE8F|nr:tetratricopeptide repeat protein [Porphyromonas macacae]
MQKTKRFFIYTFFVLFASVFYGYSQTKPADRQNIDKFGTYFYQGVLESNLAHYAEAFDLLNYCYRIDSTNAALQFQLSRLYYALDNEEKATELLKRAYRTEPANQVYAEGLATMYMARNNYAEAIDIYKKLVRLYPNQEVLTLKLADLYRRSGDIEGAIKAYDRLQEVTATTPMEDLKFTDIKVQLYQMTDDEAAIVREYKAMMGKYPDIPDFAIRLAQIYLERNKLAEAKEILDFLTEKGETGSQYYLALTQYYLKNNMPREAFNKMRMILGDNDIEVNQKVLLLMRFLGQDKDKEHKPKKEYNILFEELMQLYPEEYSIPFAYSQVLAMQGNNAEAVRIMEKVTHLNPAHNLAWDFLLQNALQNQDYERVVKLSEQALQHIPHHSLYYLYGSGAYIAQKKYKEAKLFLLKGVETLGNSDSAGLSDIYGQLGDISGEMGQHTEQFGYYEKALEFNPENVAVLNNYAYELTKMKGADLSKAERMAATTVRIEPENPIFLDTYGWVFFCRGNYSLAKLYLQKAVDKSEEEPDADILEHLGDCYYKLDKVEDAVTYWKKAKERRDGKTPLLDKKIKEKKYFEK